MVSEALGWEFRQVFAVRALQVLAGNAAFEAGARYASEGRVTVLELASEDVTATVKGSRRYQVELSSWYGDADYSCTCPVGATARFCKHAVAAALGVTDAIVGGAATPVVQPLDPPDLADYLRTLDHDALVALLVERADEDSLFGARLRMAAARDGDALAAVEAFRSALDSSFVTGGFVDYDEAYSYASGIETVLDSLEPLIEDGHAERIIGLAEHAADLAQGVIGYIDDSDGVMSGVAEHISRLHLAACEAGRPDPVTLARTLYDREMHDGDLEIFFGAASRYADVLAGDGLAEYRRLAQHDWDQLPALGPDSAESWTSARFRLSGIMQTLAELSGDVDAVVGVLAHDLSSSYQFVRIAQTLRAAHRYDEALEWAEKGLSAHGCDDDRLVEVVADEHHRAGRPQRAVEVVWSAYESAPGLDTYRLLAGHATRAGLWQEWRDRALVLLRKRIAANTPTGPDNSALVAVLLFDEDPDRAWVEAQAAGCHRDQWLELASRRETDHPSDAIPIWREEVGRAIAVMNNQSYVHAVSMIERVGRLMAAAGCGEEFAPYVAGVRAAHARKRNLMKLLTERGW